MSSGAACLVIRKRQRFYGTVQQKKAVFTFGGAEKMAGNGISSSVLKNTTYNVSSIFGNSEYVSLISGYQWGTRGEGVRISYSFPGQNGAPAYFAPGSTEWSAGGASLNSTQIGNIRLALAEWEEVSNIDFYEVPDNQQQVGDIRFAFSSSISESYWGYAYYPTSNAVGGDIWINDNYVSNSFAAGTYDFIATLHEIGHAIGLKHPHEKTVLNNRVMTDASDDVYNTVMSYDHASLNSSSQWPSTLGRFDEQAIDVLYGLEAAAAEGVHRFFNTETGGHFFTLSDAEAAHVRATLPHFRQEGTGFGGFATDQGATTEEVYRFFNTKTGGHFFTTSEVERDHVTSTLRDFRFEGIAFFAPDDGATLML